MSRWNVLSEREGARRMYSAINLRKPHSPEETYYSVQRSKQHKTLNRYIDILAYDRTAVDADGTGAYINANVVKDGYGGWWVAAQRSLAGMDERWEPLPRRDQRQRFAIRCEDVQSLQSQDADGEAPLPSTIPAFVTAIKTHAVSRHPYIQATTRGAIVVQLTGYEERGMRKADPYLDFFDHVSTTDRRDLGSVLTEMRADTVDVSHYHFTAWPDHGVPAPRDQPALRALVLEVGRRQREEQKEVWVHCSAGVGRSGAFIALSSLLLRSGTYIPPEHPSPLPPLDLPLTDVVAHTIDQLREYRGMLVQTPQQLELVDEMYKRYSSASA